MSENVVEIGNDKPTEQVDNKTREKSEFEKTLETMLKNAYVKGLSIGMKTMCEVFLQRMNGMHGTNPQKQLIALRQLCMTSLAKQDNFAKKNDENNNTEKEKEQ